MRKFKGYVVSLNEKTYVCGYAEKSGILDYVKATTDEAAAIEFNRKEDAISLANICGGKAFAKNIEIVSKISYTEVDYDDAT